MSLPVLMLVGLAAEHLGLCENPCVDCGLALDDFAGREIAILLGLNQRVFIDGLAEILVIVRGDFVVFRGGERDRLGREGLGLARGGIRPAPFGRLGRT